MSKAAANKALGENIEDQIIDRLDLRPAQDRDAYYDAIANSVISGDPGADLWMGGICLVNSESRIEIKSARDIVSMGSRDRPGLWYFKEDQHRRLTEASENYLLAVHDGSSQPAPDIQAMILCPASTIDIHLSDRWYDVDRSEGSVAQLPWDQILDPNLDLDRGDQRDH